MNPGANRAQVLQQITEVASKLTQINSAHGVRGRYLAYCNWAAEAVRQLRNGLTQREVEQLILTRRYWALQGLNLTEEAPITTLLGLELDERASTLQVAQLGLQAEIDWWNETGYRVVPD